GRPDRTLPAAGAGRRAHRQTVTGRCWWFSPLSPWGRGEDVGWAMLDARIRRLIDPPLDWAGAVLARRGVGANAVTVAGFLFGVAAWVALALAVYPLALGLILANRLADGLDGAGAPRRRPPGPGGHPAT